MLLIAPLCFMACSENEDTVEEFPDWKNRNEAYFDNIYEKAMGIEDGSWKIIRNYSLEDTIPAGYADHIVVEVLEEGTGSGCPMFTDSVLVHYRGRSCPQLLIPRDMCSTRAMRESSILRQLCLASCT